MSRYFKFGNVSGPRVTKWPKLNHWLKIVDSFTCVQYFQWSVTHIIEIFKFGNVSCPRGTKWPRSLLELIPKDIKKSSNPYCRDIQMSCNVTSFVGRRDTQKLIWIDTQGSVTHIVEIFKFGNVSGPRTTKCPKLNHRLKIVNYFTCVWHFFCR